MKTLLIANLCVGAMHRNRGLGSRLFGHRSRSLLECSAAGRVGAEVRPQHAPSPRLFAQNGVEVVERTDDSMRLAVTRKGVPPS